MKKALLGNGGMAKELSWIKDIEYCYDDSMPFAPECEYLIAVGYPETKRAIIRTISNGIVLANAEIHPMTFIGENVIIGYGSVICAFVSITADTTIGNMASINNSVTIGHDCKIGNMFHASPGAVVSGNVNIGDCVFMGANSVIKEKISVCDDVIIGAGAIVVKDIIEPGKYAGNPAVKL